MYNMIANFVGFLTTTNAPVWAKVLGMTHMYSFTLM